MINNSSFEIKYDSVSENKTIADKNIKLTVILACFGNINAIAEPLRKTFQKLESVKDTAVLIIAVDGSAYLDISYIKAVKDKFPYVKILVQKIENHKPAALINGALKHANTQYVSFAWAGSHFDDLAADFSKSADKTLPVYLINNASGFKLASDPNPALIYGWLQCKKLYSLNNIIIAKDVLNTLGEFDEAILLQRHFDWEWMLRLARQYMITVIGTAREDNILELEYYPLNQVYNFSNDIIHRYVIRIKALPYKASSCDASSEETAFLMDLPITDTEAINNELIKHGEKPYSYIPAFLLPNKGECYKITIIGGYWEYHHNQLAFFNYFDKLYGKGFATYKVLLDITAEPWEIDGSDLVIITRSRVPKILSIIEQCKKQNIAVLYMIDDNWFYISDELPEVYGNIFKPGNPQFDTFLEAIKNCDGVLTYNINLQKDIKKYNENVILFPLSMDLELYKEFDSKSLKHQGGIVIGYAGSYRHDDTAFIALSNAARKRANIKVLLFGTLSNEQKKLFDNLDVYIIDYLPYFIFCKKIVQISPDILLAPLMPSKTTLSKCPNKYLEAGAVGAAGVYTDVYPYNEVVKENITGVFVSSNSVEEWEEKILMLADNKMLLEKIKKECSKDIRRSYSIEKNISKFCKMIKNLITGSEA